MLQPTRALAPSPPRDPTAVPSLHCRIPLPNPTSVAYTLSPATASRLETGSLGDARRPDAHPRKQHPISRSTPLSQLDDLDDKIKSEARVLCKLMQRLVVPALSWQRVVWDHLLLVLLILIGAPPHAGRAGGMHTREHVRPCIRPLPTHH